MSDWSNLDNGAVLSQEEILAAIAKAADAERFLGVDPPPYLPFLLPIRWDEVAD